jgi:hypothetical protein
MNSSTWENHIFSLYHSTGPRGSPNAPRAGPWFAGLITSIYGGSLFRFPFYLQQRKVR